MKIQLVIGIKAKTRKPMSLIKALEKVVKRFAGDDDYIFKYKEMD